MLESSTQRIIAPWPDTTTGVGVNAAGADIVRAVDAGRAGTAATGAGAVLRSSGTANENVEPAPGAERTSMTP